MFLIGIRTQLAPGKASVDRKMSFSTLFWSQKTKRESGSVQEPPFYQGC